MHARALPSVPGHVPIWANFVVYGPILKISNAMCISNGNLEFSPQMTHYACPGITQYARACAHLG